MPLFFALILLFVSSAVHAEDEGHLRFLKYQADYQVNADASYSVVQEISYRLFTDVALVSSGKMPITYNSRLEDAEVLEAFTLKKDGRRIDVGAAGIQIQHGQMLSGYGISQADQRTVMLTFPQLEPGDAVSYKFRLTQKTPLFAGQFYASTNFARNLAWDAVDISMDLPATMPMRSDAVRLDALPPIEREGRIRYGWRARNLPVASTEASAVDLFSSTPHLLVSTFTDWQQFAAAYEMRAKPMAAITPDIRQLAATITAGQSEPSAKARALYDWVAANIRYVASWIGSDGWVPHPAASVLANRYGDCKDHVVLLEALLAAQGIDSTTVMINSDKTSYSLPPVVHPAFNHVITYVPTLNLYLDSTAGSSTPFGVLPISDVDKPVVHTGYLPLLGRTPALDPSVFSAVRTTRLRIDEDGNAVGDFQLSANGTAAIDLRDMRQSIGRRMEKDWVREQLDARGLEGSGTVQFEEAADANGVTLRMDVRLRNFMALAENGTIPLSPLLTGPISFEHLHRVYQRAERTLPYWCPAWTLEDRYEIRLPPAMTLLLPKGQTLDAAGFSYSSRYAFADGVLTAVRKLSITHSALACAPAEFASGKAAVARIERDLRGQVIYQLADGQAAVPLAQAATTALPNNQQAK